MIKKNLLIALSCLCLAISYSQTTQTLNYTSAQSAYYSSFAGRYYVDGIGSGSHSLGHTSVGSPNQATRGRYKFHHPGRLNSEISKITLKITFGAGNLSNGVASATVSLSNIQCNANLSWTISGSSLDINSDQALLLSCIGAGNTYNEQNISTSNILSSTIQKVLYTRNSNAATNLNFLTPDADYFTLCILEGAGSINISSVQAIVDFDLQAPAAPAVNAAAAINQSVKLTWAAVATATSYEIYTATGTTPVTTTSLTTITIPGLSPCISHGYRIKAKNSAGLSPFSNTAAATPLLSAPATFSAVMSPSQIQLAWSPVTGATSYILSSNNGLNNVTLPSGTLNYTHTSVTPGTYNYVIYAAGSGCNGYTANLSATLLATPVIISVSPQDNQALHIVWNPVSGATSYDVYTATETAPFFNTTSASATFTGLDQCTEYGYRIQAKNSSGSSSISNVSSAKTRLAALTGLTVQTNTTAVQLAWNALPGATGYLVVKNTAPNTNIPLPVNPTSYTDSDVETGDIYNYLVSGTGQGCAGDQTVIQAIMPLGTPFLDILPVTKSNALTLFCSNLNGANFVDLYTSSGTTPIQSFAVPSDGFLQVTGLQPLTFYSYKIKTRRSTGQTSDFSNVVSAATRFANAPAVSASNYLGNIAIKISWTAVSGAASYDVFRVTVTGNVLLTNTTQLSYINTGLSPLTQYNYKVRAKDILGNYTDYGSASATTIAQMDPLNPIVQPLPTFSGPPAVTASPVWTQVAIKLTWTSIPGAINYEVYRVTVAGNLLLTSTPLLTYTDAGISPSTLYNYKVRAVNSDGMYSDYGSASATTIAIGNPTNPPFGFGLGQRPIDVYPNPVVDILKIDSEDEWTSADLFDIEGRLINTFNLVESHELDLRNLLPGAYLLKIHHSEFVTEKRIIKQ